MQLHSTQLAVSWFVFWFSSKLVPGFSVSGVKPAFIAALTLARIQMLLGYTSGHSG
jgi:uncharacterized membrane protein YvlD (DUF360 family)